MALADILGELLDPDWYCASYPDVRALGVDPVAHFINHGLDDGRNPNGWFHRSWYEANYPDVATSGLTPLLHYLRTGAALLYNPHPRFDAAWYVRQHPEAAPNPLLHHMRVGQARDWDTEPGSTVADYLPSTAAPSRAPPDVRVDVVMPVRTGLDRVQRCVEAILADPDRPPGRIILVDDASPEPALSAWIDRQAAERRIERLRNRQSRGFAASANRGIAAAGTHDVLLLNGEPVLPPNAIGRMAAQAYAGGRIASVSPLSGPEALDAVCQAVNAGRAAAVPGADPGCVYVRRAAFAAAGVLDEAAFADAPDAVTDFCLRTAGLGWGHVQACDVWVEMPNYSPSPYGRGLGGGGSASRSSNAAGQRPPTPPPNPLPQGEGEDRQPPPPSTALIARHPGYPAALARHAVANPAGPFRFAITAGLFRQSGKPTVLMIFHGLGGGAKRQMTSLITRFGAQANFLLLFATSRGVALTAPAIPDHPLFIAAPDRIEELVQLLRSCAVTRAHIHHLKGLDYDVRGLIRRLDVPFDMTVHDYFALCPQVNLLPWPDAPYCGEPGPAGCNACIAARPADGAVEILAWRGERAWQFLQADRVFCPSQDVFDRLARHGLAARAVVVPHEPVTAGPWPMKAPSLRGPTLRIALLGVMANLKGAVAVAALAERAGDAHLEIHIIGPVEGDFPARARDRVHITGAYQEAELPTLLAKIRPHVVWFPSPCPETYSYTLSTAIEAGLPIVATSIGSFPERLAGRPLTWMAAPNASTADWLGVFDAVRAALRTTRRPPVVNRPPVADGYTPHYLAPKPRGKTKPPRRTTILVIPERRASGVPSDRAYQRLLLPLDHLARGMPLDIIPGDAADALAGRADLIVTHRNAVPDVATAEALGRHARATGAALVYDLDEALRSPVVRRMLLLANRVTVPGTPLAAGTALIVPDGLDERLWCARPRPSPSHAGVVRILLLGRDVRDADLGLIMPAVQRLKQEYGGWVVVEFLGLPATSGLPPWVAVTTPPGIAGESYPGFVHWLIRQSGWDIGLAPGSASGVLDYAALGMAVLASDRPVWRGSLADGPGGMLVGDADWYASINWLIRNPALRRDLAAGARRMFLESDTLETRTAAWRDVLAIPHKTAVSRPQLADLGGETDPGRGDGVPSAKPSARRPRLSRTG